MDNHFDIQGVVETVVVYNDGFKNVNGKYILS